MFADWTGGGTGGGANSDVAVANAAAKRSRAGPGPLRLRSDADSFETAAEYISMDDLSLAEQGGVAGGVPLAAASRTNLRSLRRCDARHVIGLAYKVAIDALFIAAAVETLKSAWGSGADKSKDTAGDRDACIRPRDTALDDRACVSWARADPLLWNDEAVQTAIADCVSQCIAKQMSCQRSWVTKTQQNNCKGWLPWSSSKCPVEEHVNNICISDRPNGCTINKALNVDVPDPE